MGNEKTILERYKITFFEKSLNAFARKYNIQIASDIKSALLAKNDFKEFKEKYGAESEEYLFQFNKICQQKEKEIIKNPFRIGQTKECEICGYNEDPVALCIHHLRPELKPKELEDFKKYIDLPIIKWASWWKKYSKFWITTCLNCHTRIHRFPKWKNRAEFLSWKKKQH